MNILISWLGPLRAICMAIDRVAYSVLDNAYNLVIALSKAEFLNHDSIKSLMGNLYVLFGVVAFFRLAMVLVNAIIDPEKLNEKGKGLSNIFFRVVGMIILLAVTPFLFQMSYELQGKIVGSDTGSNLIFKILLGDKANIDGENQGKALQNIALSSLITIDDAYADNFESLQCKDNGDETCTNQGGYTWGSECDWDNCEEAVSLWNDEYVNEDMSPSKLAKYAGVSKMIDGEEVYVYNYMMIVTTAVGIFMTYVIISFAIDIAVRMFELVVLEVLSPLFIATFVDPKSAQSGPFKNWLSAVGKSYASLYLRLAIIALMILLVSIINQSKMFQSMGDVSGWAKIFMVIGLLIFAKKAPKWIGDMIGIKGEGGLGGLSMAKKLGGMALAGGLAQKGAAALKTGAKAVGGGVASRLGGTAAARRLKRDQQKAEGKLQSIKDRARQNGGSYGKALGSYFNDERKRMADRAKAGILGGQAAAMQGFKAGAQAKDAGEVAKLFGSTYKNMTAEAAHEGIGAKINAKLDDVQANLKAKAIGDPADLRKLKENREKIAKANKLRNEDIKLENGERSKADFQNGNEMNNAAKLATQKGTGFKLDHDPTSDWEVYAADMVNHGKMKDVKMSADGKITEFKNESGTTISGDNVMEELEAYGKAKFSMAGMDQIKLDCANNASRIQSEVIGGRAKIKELSDQSAELDVNLSNLNINKAKAMQDLAGVGNISFNIKTPDGSKMTVNKSATEVYAKYVEAKNNGKTQLASTYETALKDAAQDQFTVISSIDNSISSVTTQKIKIENDKTAWKTATEKKEETLVNLCKQFDDGKDNPIANADGVTIVGSYDESGGFNKNSVESKTYSSDSAIQNTQTKISKLQEKAKASLEDKSKSSKSDK